MDWFSRRVLAWRLSTGMETGFCVEALREALDRYGSPDIFNTDQGVQFTNAAVLNGIGAPYRIRIRQDLGWIEEGHLMPDHVHMMI